MPGSASLDAQHGGVVLRQLLRLEVGIGIQAQQAIGHIVVIVAVKVAVGVLVIEAHFRGSVLLTVDHGGGGRTGDDIAPPNKGSQGYDHEDRGDSAIQDVAALFGLALLRFADGLGVGLADILLTELLFSRCAHLYSFLSKFQVLCCN